MNNGEDTNLEAEVEPGYDRQSGVSRGEGPDLCLIVAAGIEEHRIALTTVLKRCPFGGTVQEDFPCVHMAIYNNESTIC